MNPESSLPNIEQAILSIAQAIQDRGFQSLLLGQAVVTGNQGSISTETDITGQNITVIVPDDGSGGSWINLRSINRVAGSSASSNASYKIKESSTTLQQGDSQLDTANIGQTIIIDHTFYATAGSHTYKVSLTKNIGGGSLTNYATSTNPSCIQATLV